MIKIRNNIGLLTILSMFLILLIGCDTNSSFEIDRISSGDGLNGLTQDEIALIETIKYHQSLIFQIPFDEYKAVYETYYLIPSNITKMKAYDMSFRDVDDDLLMSNNFIGLNIKESRDMLKSINVDLDFLDKHIENYGNPNYKLYISEIIKGYSDDESMIYVMHEVDIIDEDYDEAFTEYYLTKYIFKEVDGLQKIYLKSRIYGFRYYEDENRESFEDQMVEFLSRNFIDGEPNYIIEVDLNKILD